MSVNTENSGASEEKRTPHPNSNLTSSQVLCAAAQLARSLEEMIPIGTSKKDVQRILDALLDPYGLKTCSSYAYVGRQPHASSFEVDYGNPKSRNTRVASQGSNGTGKQKSAPKPKPVATYDKQNPDWVSLSKKMESLQKDLKQQSLTDDQKNSLLEQRRGLAAEMEILKKSLQAVRSRASRK
jgi:hypothetical protein